MLQFATTIILGKSYSPLDVCIVAAGRKEMQRPVTRGDSRDAQVASCGSIVQLARGARATIAFWQVQPAQQKRNNPSTSPMSE